MRHPSPDSPVIGRAVAKVMDRFIARVRTDDNGHWMWEGRVDARTGYGYFNIENRQRLAHRVSWELYVGPIQDGYEIDHVCKVRACVNPAHLEAVTKQENMRRIRKKSCHLGHPYDEANTGVISTTGQRYCRECRRMSTRAADVRRNADPVRRSRRLAQLREYARVRRETKVAS